MNEALDRKYKPWIEELLAQLRQAVSVRHDDLFAKFLPNGYEMTTLSSVEKRDFERALQTKVRIGTLITVYDDFADHPGLRNPRLLRELYRIPFEAPPRLVAPAPRHPVVQLVEQLWSEVMSAIRTFPNFELLKDVFEFDVQQFYNANRYSELITDRPTLANQIENRAYAPHNMGILIVGMVDLMASPGLLPEELGRIRSFIHRAQEAARIMNVLATLDREATEGDITGEVASAWLESTDGGFLPTPESFVRSSCEKLARERERLLEELQAQAERIRSFDGRKYVQGLRSLYHLHESMKKVI